MSADPNGGAPVADQPIVDVVIPTRNRLALTLEAIRSVEAQTYPHWRLYVVDDVSDDGSVDQLTDCVRDKPQVSVVALTENAGAAGARHAGFLAGDGAFVATLDSDDVWFPTKLEKQVARHLETADLLPDVGGVLCGHCWTDENLAPETPAKFPSLFSRSPLVSNNMSTLLVTRAALTQAGGFSIDPTRRYPQCEGVEAYVRFSRMFAFVSVPELLVLCRRHTGTRESDLFHSRQAAESLEGLIGDYLEYLSSLPNDLASLRALLGARYFVVGELRRGLGEMALALRLASMSQRAQLVRRYGPLSIKSAIRALGG